MRLVYLLSILCSVGLISCLEEADGPFEDNRFIKDEFGRTLILHGLNTSSSAKYGDYLPWIEESDVEQELSWGFNVVRYLTSWEAIEPQRGVIDFDHIDDIEERIEWYTSREIYVIIDMHQDVYGPAVGGNGHPEWATETNGLTYSGGFGQEWWLNNLDPATIAAYQNFWRYTTHQYLQDHYIKMWLEVVDRFKNNPFVLGYDLMNEPHAGDLSKTINSTFEKFQLKNFSDRLIQAIRTIDNDKYIFFEAQSLGTNLGLPSNLPKLSDPRSGQQKLVYAPHCYPLFVDLGGGAYNQNGANNVAVWESSRVADLNRHQTPMLIGEFGLSPTIEGFDLFIQDFHDMSDRLQASWTYWSNDQGGWSPTDGQGNETPILNELIRTYPQAIAGRLIEFKFDKMTKEFNLTFVNNTDINMPTEIFIPNRFYENGWNIAVTGDNNWTQEWVASDQILLFDAYSNQEYTITISPA